MTSEAWSFHIDQLRSSTEALSNAKAARDRQEVLLAASSWSLRFQAAITSFFGLDDDCGESKASAGLQNAQRQAEMEVHRHMSRRVTELIASVPAEAEKFLALQARRREHSTRVQRIQAVGHLVDHAHDALERAASECSGAGTMETLDLFTGSKAISLISTMSTSSASGALRRAQDALRELQAKLPKRAAAGEIPEVSDLLDLAVDLLIDVPFDFTSFLNLSSLDGAERKVREAAQSLAPLQDRVRVMLRNQKLLLDELENEIHKARSVYVAMARHEIPEPLRDMSRTWKA